MAQPRTSADKALALFNLAAVLTFGFITALQFMPLPWFFLALVAMHGGIALFIVSKRAFKRQGFEVALFYRTQYLLLVPYVCVMAYTFAARAGIVALFAQEKAIAVLCYSAFCAGVTIWNYLRLKRSLEQHASSDVIMPAS